MPFAATKTVSRSKDAHRLSTGDNKICLCIAGMICRGIMRLRKSDRASEREQNFFFADGCPSAWRTQRYDS